MLYVRIIVDLTLIRVDVVRSSCRGLENKELSAQILHGSGPVEASNTRQIQSSAEIAGKFGKVMDWHTGNRC